MDYKTILSVNALIFCQEKVLLLKRAANKSVDPGRLSNIGGKVEPGESFWGANIREVAEETGIAVTDKNTRLFAITQIPDPAHGAEWVSASYVVTIKKQIEFPPTDDGEFMWINPVEINRFDVVVDVQDYLEILAKNPKAFISGFYRFDAQGKLLEKLVNVF